MKSVWQAIKRNALVKLRYLHFVHLDLAIKLTLRLMESNRVEIKSLS